MPVKRRTPKARIGEFTVFHAAQLFSGHDFFDSAYGEPLSPEALDLARADWFEHRDEIIEQYARSHPGKKPWAQVEFEQPETVSQEEQ